MSMTSLSSAVSRRSCAAIDERADVASSWLTRELNRFAPTLNEMYAAMRVTVSVDSSTVIATVCNCSDERHNRMIVRSHPRQSR